MANSRAVSFIHPWRSAETSTRTLRKRHAAIPKRAAGCSSPYVRPQKTSERCAIPASIGETTERCHSVAGLTLISCLDSRQFPTDQEVDRWADLQSGRECGKTPASMLSKGGSGNGRWAGARGTAALLGACVLLGACGADAPHAAGTGAMSGQVVVSGPLRGATVSVEQIDYASKTSVATTAHVGSATTDDDGLFHLPDIGTYNGLLLITATGGEFTDLATGAAIQLDPGAGLETIADIDLLEENDDILVSPVGHLIAARTRWKMIELGDVVSAEKDAASHISRHFGNVPWSRLKLASLETPTTSPTEPLRGALVQAALSVLAREIIGMSGASPQEVNVLTLTKQLALDVGQGVFDGNDGNDATPGSGLQLGVCGSAVGCTAPPDDACARDLCRPLCDLYAGTPRARLADKMNKVIGDRMLNKTGLVSGDILAVARSMADNVDPDLFAPSPCSETLDRLPPTLSFGEKPADGAFVHGTVQITATAIDDIDVPPSPAVEFAGYADTDGDPHNNVATVIVDTTTMADGPLTVTARAADAAGNPATIMRVLQVDNTAPVVALDRSGFVAVVDERNVETWWTTIAAPTLTGTVIEAHPISVEAVIGAKHVPGTITGSTWNVQFEAGTIDLIGADVHVVLTDAAGNQGVAVQRVRYDATAPVVSFRASPVHDEASETPTFDTNEAPIHVHSGAEVDLASGCPSITKYSYLLNSTPPPYGSESGKPNRLQYNFLVSDDGVGIALDKTQYRVGRDAGGATQWIATFSLSGSEISVGAGVTRYEVPIYADKVAGLDTIEGAYRVEFRGTDLIGRETTAERCFVLTLRAPPLHLGPMRITDTKTYNPGDAQGHMYALKTLSLAPAPAFNQIAARVLNAGAASSLLDMPVVNGTASTVYLAVSVTKPGGMTASQTFTRSYVRTITDTTINCDDSTDPRCGPAPLVPPFATGGDSHPVGNLLYPVRVYQLDAGGAPVTQIPCLGGCQDTDTVFRFAIPPRGNGAAPLRFLVMSMVGQIPELWPRNGDNPATPPFLDTTVNGIHITGLHGPFTQGCTRTSIRTGVLTCVQVTTYDAYRELTSASLTASDPLISTYATAAGSTTSFADAWGSSLRTLNLFPWSTTQVTLP